MITHTKKLLAALALVAMGSTAAMAQTDFGSPIGGGAGVGGSVAPLGIPNAENGGTARGASNALSGNGTAGLANARTSFMNSAAGGVSVSNPATGGTVMVTQTIARALGGLLGGRPTPAQVSAVSGGLTGVPAASATALTNALTAFGASATRERLIAAITAYNAALNAMPAGATPSPAMLAIRSALSAASRS